MGEASAQEQLTKYLTDVHSIEEQAIAQLEVAPRLAREHLEETREHQRLIEERLSELDARPSRFQAGAMRLGALNLSGFFKAQPDTPAKLAGFAYAFEALECGAYELLARTARRAHDEESAALAERILAEERAAAEKVAGTWDAAAEVALREQDVAAT
jgi:ferritin-like metal-binding protein YciE